MLAKLKHHVLVVACHQVGLLGPDGSDIELHLEGKGSVGTAAVLRCDKDKNTFTFTDVAVRVARSHSQMIIGAAQWYSVLLHMHVLHGLGSTPAYADAASVGAPNAYTHFCTCMPSVWSCCGTVAIAHLQVVCHSLSRSLLGYIYPQFQSSGFRLVLAVVNHIHVPLVSCWFICISHCQLMALQLQRIFVRQQALATDVRKRHKLQSYFIGHARTFSTNQIEYDLSQLG